MSTVFLSDMDRTTPIVVTYDYATAHEDSAEERFQGPTEREAYVHVRVNPHTESLRRGLHFLQGHKRTQFCGAWTAGLTLHEDAVVSGLEAANHILVAAGLSTVAVLRRATELPSCGMMRMPLSRPELSVAELHTTQAAVGTASSAVETACRILCDITGEPVGRSTCFSDLSLPSMALMKFRNALTAALGVPDERVSLTAMLEVSPAWTVAELVAHLGLETTQAAVGTASSAVETACRILCDITGEPVGRTTCFSDLSLPSMALMKFRNELTAALGVPDERVSLTAMLEVSPAWTVAELVAHLGLEAAVGTSIESRAGRSKEESVWVDDVRAMQLFDEECSLVHDIISSGSWEPSAAFAGQWVRGARGMKIYTVGAFEFVVSWLVFAPLIPIFMLFFVVWSMLHLLPGSFGRSVLDAIAVGWQWWAYYSATSALRHTYWSLLVSRVQQAFEFCGQVYICGTDLFPWFDTLSATVGSINYFNGICLQVGAYADVREILTDATRRRSLDCT